MNILWRDWIIIYRSMKFLCVSWGAFFCVGYKPLWFRASHRWDPMAKATQIAKFIGPTWGPHGSCRPQMGPMLGPWTLLSGNIFPKCGVSHLTSRSRPPTSRDKTIYLATLFAIIPEHKKLMNKCHSLIVPSNGLISTYTETLTWYMQLPSIYIYIMVTMHWATMEKNKSKYHF